MTSKETIAIYPGSFNPFHVGHLNILHKAERIFGYGNVIISIGINPDKNTSIIDREADIDLLKERLERKVIVHQGFLHTLIEKYEEEGYNVVIIRGLRNGADLDYEVNQMRFLNDFKKDINTIFIACDKEYEHISSSAIRKIDQFGGHSLSKDYKV